MARRVALATRSEEKAEPYRDALRQVGLEPVDFTPGCGRSLDEVDGLVMTGGTDVDPSLYGQSAHPATDAPDRERDDHESELLREALARDMPVLAICRGMQLFNVVQGGTLIQHLPETERHRKPSEGDPVHHAVLEGPMAEAVGASNVAVNSRHHQAVGRLGEGLVVTARDSEDGVVEGFVYPAARFAMGVQWHPENMMEDEYQAGLFRSFAAAVAGE